MSGLRKIKFNIDLLDKNQKETRKRVLEISFKRNLSHLGSCLSCIDLIDAIYQIKKPEDKFILSNGHAGIAWYVILEKNKLIGKDDIYKLNVHPDRNPKLHIPVSTGSLGQGLPIALGMALANKGEHVYCIISDGECAEGSIWETLRIAADKKIRNLKIVVNANSWGAYDPIDLYYLKKRFKGFGYAVVDVNGHEMKKVIKITKNKFPSPTIIFAKTSVEQFSFLKGQDSHYYTMTEEDYLAATKLLL